MSLAPYPAKIQHTQQAQQQRQSPDSRQWPSSLLDAPAPSGDSSDLGLFGDVSLFLDLLPLDYNFDTQAVYQTQGLDDATLDFGNTIQTNMGDGLFDNIMIPDLNVALDTQQTLDMGDGFLAQEQPRTINSSPSEQPSTSNTPNPTNKSSSSIPGTSTFSLHPSPSSSSGSSRKRKSSPEDEDSSVALKRQRNTLAARKYRQKRLDRITELEDALAAMKDERDDMRLQLARREAEVDALREMLGKK
ncbi:hypothetical protein FGRMN_1210 [Fusarium graminum]|nr:hypothetical protein FGRMN_1210 [Fusarium graminum]